MEYIKSMSESQRRLIIKILCLALLVVFALPFITVSCQGSELVKLSGYNLAFGKEIDNQMTGDTEKIEPAIPAVIALIVAAIGLVIAFIIKNDKQFNITTSGLGVIGFLSMLLLKSGINTEIQKQSLKVEFHTGFTLATTTFLIIAVIGAVFYYIVRNIEEPQDIIISSGNSKDVGGE